MFISIFSPYILEVVKFHQNGEEVIYTCTSSYNVI